MKIRLDKKAKSVIIVYAILAVVYIAAFLVIPFHKNAASWICFAFTVISLAASLFICGYAFQSKETLVSKVYGFPVFRVGAIYALAQFIVGVIICLVAAFINVPYWVALVISLVLLGAAAIGVIATDNVRDMVEEMDSELKANVKTVTFFQIDIAGIVDSCEDGTVKADLEKLCEKFRFSDPVSSKETEAVEKEIKTLLDELKTAIAGGNYTDAAGQIKRINIALNERNRLCKAGKE